MTTENLLPFACLIFLILWIVAGVRLYKVHYDAPEAVCMGFVLAMVFSFFVGIIGFVVFNALIALEKVIGYVF